MKKLLSLLLSGMVVLSFTSCVANTETSSENTTDTSQISDNDNSSKKDNTSKDNFDPMEKMLNKAGVTLEDIQPTEETFDMVFDSDDDEISFYMEKETERDASAYMNKIVDTCKATSDDGKLYEANFNFFMGTDMTEFPPLPSSEEINDGMIYLMQFGYLKNGATITVTAARLTDMHPERNDDIYYPVYTISFGF